MSLFSHVLNWILGRPSTGPIPPSGYYWTLGGYGDWLDQIPIGHTLAYTWIADGSGKAEYAATAERLAKRKMKAILHGFGYLQAQGNLFVLTPDWQARLTAQLPLIAELRSRGAFHSYYVMDEPGNRVPRADLTAVCGWLKDHGVATMMVDTSGWCRETWRARLVTYYGLDGYGPDAAGNWTMDLVKFEKELRIAGANTVVGQAFNQRGFPIPDPRPQVLMARRIRAKVLMWFIWPAVGGDFVTAGTSPDVARTIQRACIESGSWQSNVRET